MNELEDFAKKEHLTDDEIYRATTLDTNFSPINVSTNELNIDDQKLLHSLEKKNKVTYNSGYVSEFLKCRANPLYFIHK